MIWHKHQHQNYGGGWPRWGDGTEIRLVDQTGMRVAEIRQSLSSPQKYWVVCMTNGMLQPWPDTFETEQLAKDWVIATLVEHRLLHG